MNESSSISLVKYTVFYNFRVYHASSIYYLLEIQWGNICKCFLPWLARGHNNNWKKLFLSLTLNHSSLHNNPSKPKVGRSDDYAPAWSYSIAEVWGFPFPNDSNTSCAPNILELLFRTTTPGARLKFMDRLGHYYTIPRTTFSHLSFCSFLKPNFYASTIFPIIFAKFSCNRLVSPQSSSRTWFIIFKIPMSSSILLYVSYISVSFYYLLHPENNLHSTTMTAFLLFSLLVGQHFRLIQYYICLWLYIKMLRFFTNKWKHGQLIWVVKGKKISLRYAMKNTLTILLTFVHHNILETF